MQINPAKFQTAFLQRASEALSKPEQAVAVDSGTPVDGVTLSGVSVSTDALSFQAAVSAVAASATLGGVVGLAAMAQEVARELVSPAEEMDAARRMTEQFAATLPRIEDPRVQDSWVEVSRVTESPFEAPLVFQSFFIDAQADARNIMLGTESLKGDLASDEVLAFTLAHEEGHRQHRDTAGAAGLQALLDSCEKDKELYSLAYDAMAQGRQDNERRADLFAAEAMVKLGVEKQPILEFLGSMPGDMQHPVGTERVALVESAYKDR